jgi:hypothetical protein
MPEEDLHQGIINTSAITDHEMFDSWVRAGFTREEAMQLLLQAKSNAMVQIANEEFHDKHCPDCKGE